jgi:hypothetical protein
MSNRITLDAPIAKVAKLTLAGFLIIFVLGAAKEHAPPNALSQLATQYPHNRETP